MVMNTFIQYIRNQYFQQFGYQFLKHFTPRHWLQFADDAAAITGQESETQTLLNAFDRWCKWSHMIIKVEKCHSFWMKKCKTTCEQIKPKLYLNNKLIKPVKIGESFVYLGRYFDLNMTNNDHKEILISKTNELLDTIRGGSRAAATSKMERFVIIVNGCKLLTIITKRSILDVAAVLDPPLTIDKLPLHPKHKIMLYQRYVLSKISWHLTIADLPITWVKQNLDNIVSKFNRTWLEIPVAGTLNIIRKSKNKFGLGIILISDRFTQCQVTLGNKLKNSKNRDICEIYDITKGKNITYDQYKTTREAVAGIRKGIASDTKKLTTQGLVITSTADYADKKFVTTWHKALSTLPKNIYSFVIRYLNNTLANNTNLSQWGLKNSGKCDICDGNHTLGHVVGGCITSLNEKQYNWRHDSILSVISNFVNSARNIDFYCDIEGYINPSVITGTENCLDMTVILNESTIFALELTVGFETNIEISIKRKRVKYDEMLKHLDRRFSKVNFINLSMGALGIVGVNTQITNMLTALGFKQQEIIYLVKKIICCCIKATYYVFCMRNKAWCQPSLLSW